MKRRDFCKGLAVTLAAGALAPGAALPQAGAATALVGRAVPDDYYTLWYRSDRCSADLRHRLLLQRQPVRPRRHRVRR